MTQPEAPVSSSTVAESAAFLPQAMVADAKHHTATLLALLEACPIHFDPLHDHSHPQSQPRKVAFVPIEVMEALKVGLRRGLERMK